MILTPIQTRYRGYLFRSRLEARWAVFLDAADIRFEYEAEGFHLDGIRYLPDFWLPTQRAFLEIKPHLPPAEWQVKFEPLYATLSKLANASQREVFLLTGSPNPRPFAHYFDDDDDDVDDRQYDRPRIVGFAPDKGACSARLFECPFCGRVRFGRLVVSAWDAVCSCRPGVVFEDINYDPFEWSPRLQRAMEKARSARFEHGESG